MDLHAWIADRVDVIEQLIDEGEWPPSQTEGVRLRCEADRRILDRHRSVDDGYSVACEGCGTTGICDGYAAETVNDCPELLDLGHAHGLTPEILTGLDRPQPPERTPAEPGPLEQAVATAWSDAILGSLHANAAIPVALRDPNQNGDQT
jgi:hypothetical protein